MTTGRVNPLRSVLAIIVVLQLAVGGTLAVREFTEPSVFKAADRLGESNALPLTIESGYPAAKKIAFDWSSDAQLFAVSMQIDWPLSVDPQSPIMVAPGGWIAYTFFRPGGNAGKQGTLSLFYERTSGVLVQDRIVAWPREEVVTALDPMKSPISSASAVMAIEARKGRSWRFDCPVNRHLTRISLTANTNGMPVWVVTYADSLTDRAGLLAHVDAQSGEITRLEVRTEACDPA
ncbi:MAG: hypothetical protein ACRDJH_11885 [Thermomicrobiales bacterium]